MEIESLSQVIPIQGPLLFPPARFRKGTCVLGRNLRSAALEGAISCLPGSHQCLEQLVTPGQQPEDEAGFTLAMFLSALPPVLSVPSCLE